MIIKNIKKPKEFFEALEKCKGEIWFHTKDGDVLNLKSKLCQYIVMMNIFDNAEIDEVKMFFSCPKDYALVMDFLVKG